MKATNLLYTVLVTRYGPQSARVVKSRRGTIERLDERQFEKSRESRTVKHDGRNRKYEEGEGEGGEAGDRFPSLHLLRRACCSGGGVLRENEEKSFAAPRRNRGF